MIVPLHLGADHLGFLPFVLAVAVVAFILFQAVRVKGERKAENRKGHTGTAEKTDDDKSR